MTALDPKRLFGRLAEDIPAPIRRHVFIVGSLAAAYHYRGELHRRAVNTKDADVVVHPAGDVRSCGSLARRLIDLGWRRTSECYPVRSRHPSDRLRAIRLHPPRSTDYFVELLGLPEKGQARNLVWTPFRLADGWYGICSHRFMSLTALRRRTSVEGIEYARPEMMALANLLSHPGLGDQRMSTPIQGKPLLRSAKDLGRVLALAWLAGREESERWLEPWIDGLRRCFAPRWRTLARTAGAGLRALLENPAVLEEARITTEVGLLSGRGVTAEGLKATGLRLLADVIEPMARRGVKG